MPPLARPPISYRALLRLLRIIPPCLLFGLSIGPTFLNSRSRHSVNTTPVVSVPVGEYNSVFATRLWGLRPRVIRYYIPRRDRAQLFILRFFLQLCFMATPPWWADLSSFPTLRPYGLSNSLSIYGSLCKPGCERGETLLLLPAIIY